MPAKRRFRIGLAFCAVLLASPLLVAADRLVDIPERIHGADQVVVARVASVTPSWRLSPFGDRLIVSDVQLKIEETLKGKAESTASLELAGGTLDGVTLRVADLPELIPGERAVFFLKRGSGKTRTPHLRGLGILKLDGENVVRGSSLRLQDIRLMAARGA